MKFQKLPNSFLSIFSIALVLLVSSVKAQTVNVSSIVPEEVEVWGPVLSVDMGGTQCDIRLKVLKHFGTTCVFDVELSNRGSKTITAGMGFVANNGLIYSATMGSITLKPGDSYYYRREKREVLKKGVKNDALVCKNCSPVLGFYNLKVK